MKGQGFHRETYNDRVGHTRPTLAGEAGAAGAGTSQTPDLLQCHTALAAPAAPAALAYYHQAEPCENCYPRHDHS